ncbi:TolB-like protein [Bacteroides heparinolyticus]|uniref:TolB-like protein n=1 Tax=Prevotella heparinolytica TaxID=28113 RepID=A0A4R2LE12_9BACE|nr:BF3164 family lipoprotein [Bacteroides heparinolyticus]TCO85610.1 TolB-like protein [Bacteroides heparinolyticus]
MKKYIYLLSIYALLTACATQNSMQELTLTQKIEPFREQKTLQAEKVRVNEVFAIDGIEVKKNNIFVTDSRNSDRTLYQYSLPDVQCIYTGGRRGGAENEFQLPPSFCKSTSEKIYIFGYNPFIIKCFTLDTNNQLILEKEITLPTSIPIANFMNIVNDSLLIYTTFPNKLDIKKANLKSQQSTEEEIVIEQETHKEIFFDENKGYLAANDSLIVYAYTYKKQIDFYGINDMKLHKRLIGNEITPHILIGNVKETKFHQREIVACKDYFYIRCPREKDGCFIEVYDYSGRSVAKYELDILLYAFCVDEKNRTIYGYNNDVFEEGFLKYAY